MISGLFQEAAGQQTNNNDTLTASGVWLLEGIQSYNRESYDSSIYWYDKIMPQDTNYAVSLYEKSIAYMKLKKYEEAIIAATKSDSTEQGNEPRNMTVVARSLQKQGKSAEAYQLMIDLKKKFPYNAGLYAEHAHLAMEQADWKLAQVQLDSGFRINPTFYKLHLFYSELAYVSGQPTLGILSAHFGSLSLSSSSDQVQLVQLLNLEADDNFTSDYKIPPGAVGAFPELEEINQLVKSKVCYTKNYKLKLKLDEKYIRQLQLIIENLAEVELGTHDYLSDFYLSYYKEVATKNMFEACVLYGLDAIKEAPAVAKLLKSKKVDIDRFSEWNSGKVGSLKQENFYAFFGLGKQAVFQYYKSGQVLLFGDVVNNVKYDEWNYFHENGALQAKGKYDGQGKKTGEWTYYYNNGNLSAKENHNPEAESYTYEIYYRNGNIKEKATKSKGTIEGLYTEFHPNGAMNREINVSKGSASGMFRRYSFTGNLIFERDFKESGTINPYTQFYAIGTAEQKGNILNDKLSGLIQEFYPDGKLKENVNYESDKRTGWSVTYYRNGLVSDSSFYVNGKLNGAKVSYAVDGTLNSRLEYKNGKINGLSVWYDDTDGKEYARLIFKNERLSSYEFFDKEGKVIFSREEKNGSIEWVRHTPYGNITEKGTYKKGEFDGDFESYYPNGSINKKYALVDGKIAGKYIKYHPAGGVEVEAFYNNEGNQNGWQTDYYRNGKIRSRGYYRNGKKEGLFTYYYFSGVISQNNWYEEGELQSSFEYDRDGKTTLFEKYAKGNIIEETYFTVNGDKADHLKFYAGEQDINISMKHGYTTAQGKMMNGGKNGTWKYFRGKSIPTAEINYLNGQTHGVRKNYHSTGKPQSVEFYINGLKDSLAVYYNELGQKESEKTYNLGDEEGNEKFYYANGKLQSEFINREDALHGKATMYAPDGTVMIERHYFRGELVAFSGLNKSGEKVTVDIANQTGDVQTFFKDGKLAVSYTLKNGLREGDYKLFDTNGQLLFQSTYSNGYLNGKQTDYYPGGKVLEESTFADGNLTGEQKMYYPDGKLAFKETYSENVLNGPAEYYNEKGELVKKVIYQQGYEKVN